MNEHNNSNEDPIIVCRDVNKWFGDFQALRGISMEVNVGEAVSYTHLTLPTTPYV